MSWHDRAFKAVMRLLPAEFRGDYEGEMAATFRAERRSADGPARLTRLWFATIGDVFRTAPAGHLDILRRDLAYAFRTLARRRALTLAAVLTLALGIGANAAIFSVVNGVLLAPFDYRDAGDLVLVDEGSAGRQGSTTGYLTYADLRNENLTLASTAALAWLDATLTGDGQDAERVLGARVTWNYFRTVGLTPAIGRDFAQAEDHPDRATVAIISESLWRRRFGADPNIVGRQIAVNQQTVTVTGVLSRETDDIISARKVPGTEIWMPLGYAEHLPQASRSARHIHVVGRVKDGVTATEAGVDLTRIFRSLAARHPRDYDQPRAVVTPLRDFVFGPVQRPLYLLWGAVALLLAIACTNIASLLLIRASERGEEITLRLALGLPPARLLRQLLTEAVVLSMIGGAAGVAVAYWATTLLTAIGPAEIPRLSDVSLDARVLGYAIALSLATGILFGLAPARMLIARPDAGAVASRRATSGPGAWRYRASLITGSVALSVLLLIGSGLLMRSFARLLAEDVGFAPERVLTFQISLRGERYQQNAGITQFYDELEPRLRAMPGVVSVSASSMVPLTEDVARMTIQIEDRPLENPAAAPQADTYMVRPDYFTTMGIPVLGGRRFEPADGERGAPVVIVSRAMARALWPGEDPIGRRIRVPGAPVFPLRTVVGIVGDVKHYGLHMPVTMQAYIPQAQSPWPHVVTTVIRTAADQDPLSLVSAVREQIRDLDALQPIARIQTFDDIVAKSVATRRFTLVLLAAFAGTAALLAIGGLYGALSFIISQRSRDIGVRMALGASARTIAGLVLRQGMTPACVGLGAGLLASLAIGRIIESMLYGVSSRDLTTYATVVALVVAGALAACAFPARRAASIDAVVTLRAE
jgi:putative ABC transport system permease protein